MVKRIASTALWFIASGWGLNYVALLVGIPEVAGQLIAAGLAAFVGYDPFHWFWPERSGVTESEGVQAGARPLPVRVHT